MRPIVLFVCGQLVLGSGACLFVGDWDDGDADGTDITLSTGLDTGFEPGDDPDLPTDDRPVDQSDVPPPPISGGTLLVLRDGRTAVAADPDRDRVIVIDLDEGWVRFDLTTEPGDEPGRVAEDGEGRVHVAMRSGGVVGTYDPISGLQLARRAVCGNPRGLAHDAIHDDLLVACAGGDLVRLPADPEGEVETRLSLGPDLRDVVIAGGSTYVTHFRSAVLEYLDPTGTPREPIQLSGLPGLDGTDPELDASTAWRTRNGPGNGVLMLHQAASRRAVPLFPPPDIDAYGGGRTGPGRCAGLVHTTLSWIDSLGQVRSTGPLGSTVLAVDVALSPDADTIAVAVAGQTDPFPDDALPPRSVLLLSLTRDFTVMPRPCAAPEHELFFDGQATAVAYAPDGRLVVQSREPAELHVTDTDGRRLARTVAFGGDSRADTGHALFHEATPTELACASCHPEGGDDGRVWNFDPIGPRRTQAINSGIEGTAPFHWDGDMVDLHTLIDDVRGRRMGGAPPSDDRRQALRDWLFAARSPRPIRDADDAAARRGATLFRDYGCAACHAGAHTTNNLTVAFEGGRFQVPSLHGVATHPPYFHDGSAPTLDAAVHRMIALAAPEATPTPEEVADLVAYLQTL